MSDLDIIKKIEKELNVKLMELDEIKWDSKGYTLNRKMEVTGLGLYECEIKDIGRIISPLKDLTNLATLDLERNKLIDISPLKDMTKLTILILSGNKLIDISPLEELTNLTKLDLENNKLIDISPLKDLANLTDLKLSRNQLTDITQLKDLANLTYLGLGNNKLIDISPLKDLTNLTELHLYINKLIDVSPLKDLTKLTILNLSNNQLCDISPLDKLVKLEGIYVENNKILNLNFITKLIDLRDIRLENNQISDLKGLAIWSAFSNLIHNNKEQDILIDLRRNPISDLSPILSMLNTSKLNILWKDSNHWGSIYFFNNPLKSPPIEIVKQGKEAIKNYFAQLKKQGKVNIYEAKLMLVGQPGSGKTTLMNLLFDRDFPVPDKNQKASLGIEVRPNWAFKVDDKTGLKAHIWDFGGQQIQYMLHQFFLTSDCVYVLMAEKRRELANFDYWLNIINILAKNSPVVTLFNEINIDSVSSFIYEEKKYNDLFPELCLQKLDVNFADIDDGRFDVLLNTIKKKLGNLDHIGNEVPARWVDIRRELENRREKKHININEYFEICRKFDIDKEADQMLILRYFHLLGIVLHFSDDENLCDTLFLDPNWTVDAVYSVLTDKEIEKSKGFIKKSAIDKIWSEKAYDYNERAKLLQLMLKDNFELCYKLPGSKDKYIVPLLLSPKQPEYDWDNNDNLHFRFQYPFMPKGIVGRLIVRMHEYIDQNKVWKEGVVFSKNRASAQVIEQETMKEGLKIIEIRLNGTPNSRKDLLTLIREEIKKIQNSSFPNLPCVEMVPCHCKECVIAETPYFFDYGDIETYLQKGKTKIDCRKSTEEISIANLAGSVFNIEEIESRYKRIMDENKVNIDFKPVIHVHQEQQQDATLTANQQQTVTQEVKNVQGLFKNLKDDILDEIDIEIDDEKEKKRIKNELQKAENAFNELEKAASDGKKELPESTKGRIAEFVDNLSDENSRINKALKYVSNGAEKVQMLGRIYNKFAPYFAIPSIPPILLGKEDKE